MWRCSLEIRRKPLRIQNPISRKGIFITRQGRNIQVSLFTSGWSFDHPSSPLSSPPLYFTRGSQYTMLHRQIIGHNIKVLQSDSSIHRVYKVSWPITKSGMVSTGVSCLFAACACIRCPFRTSLPANKSECLHLGSGPQVSLSLWSPLRDIDKFYAFECQGPLLFWSHLIELLSGMSSCWNFG